MYKVKFKEIATITAGQAAPKEFSINGIPFIRAGHLEELVSGSKLSKFPKISNEIAEKYKLKKLPKGSILFAKSGMSTKKNRIYISSEDTYFVSHLAAILPSKKINTSYLARYLNWYNPTNLILDDAYPSIRLEDIKELEIPLPNLSTQQKIANILDKADELRQYNKQLVEKYDALTQSLFLDMFGDPVKNEKKFHLRKLEDFYHSKKEGTKCGPFGGALKKHEFVEHGIPVWNMDNISKKGEFITKINLWINIEKYKSLNSYSVINGDIIISRAGTVGKMCIVNSSFKNSIISTNLIRLRLNEKLLIPLYFVTLMTSFKDRLGRLQTGSDGAFTHMNTGVLNELQFPYPPFELQNQFAERIQLIETQKKQAQEALEKSEALFQSLLQKAFKGELN